MSRGISPANSALPTPVTPPGAPPRARLCSPINPSRIYGGVPGPVVPSRCACPHRARRAPMGSPRWGWGLVGMGLGTPCPAPLGVPFGPCAGVTPNPAPQHVAPARPAEPLALQGLETQICPRCCPPGGSPGGWGGGATAPRGALWAAGGVVSTQGWHWEHPGVALGTPPCGAGSTHMWHQKYPQVTLGAPTGDTHNIHP